MTIEADGEEERKKQRQKRLFPVNDNSIHWYMSWRPKGRQTLTSIHTEDDDDCNIFVILSVRIPTTTCILPFVGRWQGIEDTYARKRICSWRFSKLRWWLLELQTASDLGKTCVTNNSRLKGLFPHHKQWHTLFFLWWRKWNRPDSQ